MPIIMESLPVIPIVFITDEEYTIPTSVAITSLISNKSPETIYEIHILVNRVSEESQNKLKEENRKNVSINIIEISPDDVLQTDSSAYSNESHVTVTSLIKFAIPELFRQHEKMLYLDGDTLVKSDLTELFNEDIWDVYAAVVKDMRPMVSYYPQQTVRIGTAHKSYFNTGMMLLNTRLMRKDGISGKLSQYRIEGPNCFMDQDAFNYVFGERVRYIDFKFNLTYSNYESYPFD